MKKVVKIVLAIIIILISISIGIIIYYANNSNDIEYLSVEWCEEQVNSANMDKGTLYICYASSAYANMDIETCKKISSDGDYTRNICENNVKIRIAKESKDVSKCELITGSKTGCYYALAIALCDISICDKITEELTFKESCISRAKAPCEINQD